MPFHCHRRRCGRQNIQRHEDRKIRDRFPLADGLAAEGAATVALSSLFRADPQDASQILISYTWTDMKNGGFRPIFILPFELHDIQPACPEAGSAIMQIVAPHPKKRSSNPSGAMVDQWAMKLRSQSAGSAHNRGRSETRPRVCRPAFCADSQTASTDGSMPAGEKYRSE